MTGNPKVSLRSSHRIGAVLGFPLVEGVEGAYSELTAVVTSAGRDFS